MLEVGNVTAQTDLSFRFGPGDQLFALPKASRLPFQVTRGNTTHLPLRSLPTTCFVIQ